MRPSRGAILLIGLAVFPVLDAGVAGADFSVPFTFEGRVFEAAQDGGADPTPGDVLAVGDSHVLVARVTSFSDALAPHVDPALHEYTVVLSGGTVTQHNSSAGFHVVVLHGAVHFRLIEDVRAGGTPAVFAPDPPNASAPATFADGSVVLETTLSDLVISWNASTGAGGAATIVTLSGPLAQYLNPDPDDKNALQLRFDIRIPASVSGYHAEATGAVEGTWVLPVERRSWGDVKTRYR